MNMKHPIIKAVTNECYQENQQLKSKGLILNSSLGAWKILCSDSYSRSTSRLYKSRKTITVPGKGPGSLSYSAMDYPSDPRSLLNAIWEDRGVNCSHVGLRT